MADALDWLRQALGGPATPEAAPGASWGAMQQGMGGTPTPPGILQYAQDVLSGRMAASGPVGQAAYDPNKSFRENVLDPAAHEAAMSMVGPAVIRNTGKIFGPIFHRTTANIDRLSQFDLSRASPSAVWGPAIYGTFGEAPLWNPSHLRGGRTLSGYVKGDIFDLTRPSSAEELAKVSRLLGRDVNLLPLISLERRYGSVAQGLREAGYSGLIHQGPGAAGKNIAVFDPASIIDLLP